MVFKKLNILLILTLLFSMTACSKKEVNPDVKGRFVFTRDGYSLNRVKICLAYDGKLKEIEIKAGYPRWSPSGKYFLCHSNDFYIYNKEGVMLKKIPSEYRIMDCVWDGTDKGIIDAGAERGTDKNLYDFYIIKMNIETGEKTVLHSFLDRPITFAVLYLELSPDGKTLIFKTNTGTGEDYTYIINLKNNKVEKKLQLWADSYSWYPDSKHILFGTNTDKEGNKINEAWGRLYKMNIYTEKLEIVEETVKYWYKGTRLSRDGKYLIYSKPTKQGGSQITICPTGPREETKEIPVTYPTFISGAYTQDTYPDWYKN